MRSSKGQVVPFQPVIDAFRAECLRLAHTKLESSGLSPEDLEGLRMEALTPMMTQKLHASFKQLCSLKITYWDPRNLDQPLAANPAWPPFYRLRYLRPNGDAKDDIRYTNEPASGVVAYFPPTEPWPEIIQDPEQTIIITEGELKAAKACREGFPCIGLGGVWNFRSSTLGVTFLPELETVVWVRRRVYIAFDSDVTSKTGVLDALNHLAEELMNRGALVFLVLIPEGDQGQKQGLDDWCVANPEATVYDLCKRHQPLTQVRKLFELNDRLIYVLSKSLIIDRWTSEKYTTQQLKDAYQNLDYAELMMAPNGTVSLKKAPVVTAWLKWPLRAQVQTMTYEPGAPTIVHPEDPIKSTFNLWPGWGVQPVEGDVQPFLDLLDHLFAGAAKEDQEWFLRWCAYPLQYPGTKLFTTAVIHGIKHGTGKSLVGYTLGKIYGKNFTEINQNSLHAGFNTWAEAKQLVMGDDVTGSNKRADNDLLKKLITQKELRVNTKFMPEYVVPDCVNYFFTSNHPDAFFLEDDDRRYFIHEVLAPPQDESFYMDYGLWLDTTGPAALFDYLLKLDLQDFNPNAPARRTVAKEQMTADTKSDLSSWVAKLRSTPDDVLKVGSVVVSGDLFTSGELLVFYDPESSSRVTANGLSRELRRAGVLRVNQGLPVKGPNGTDRFYAVKNAERWATATPAEITAQLVLQVGGGPKAKKF